MKLFEKIFSKKSSGSKIENVNFKETDELMNEDVFWDIINRTKENSENDYDVQKDQLEIELEKLTPNEIILFYNRFRYFRGLAYTWELWGAIYLIKGGCGDDSFNDFRELVIAKGKDFYYKAIENPEVLSEMSFSDIVCDWEGLGYIPDTVFEKKTGKNIPSLFTENITISGDEWEEDIDELEKKFPKIAVFCKKLDGI